MKVQKDRAATARNKDFFSNAKFFRARAQLDDFDRTNSKQIRTSIETLATVLVLAPFGPPLSLVARLVFSRATRERRENGISAVTCHGSRFRFRE